MESQLGELKKRLGEVRDLYSAAAVLSWDQATYMPPGGAAARGRQMATLARLAHEKFIDPAIGELLESLLPLETSQPYDSFGASLIRVTRQEYEKATRIPPELMAEIYSHTSEMYHRWSRARPENDFASLAEGLERTVELSRQVADCFPGYEHIADPLIDQADRGMKVSTLRPLFAALREELVPLVEAISEQPPIDASLLHQHYPEEQQWAFGLEVIERLGYDMTRGRLDKTAHPFMTGFSLGDIRITTRVKENDLSEALFSTIHEAGHALYEQGGSPELEGTPLAGGTSAGVHESQSRLWENIVGRSRGFWGFFYPRLQAQFPEQLGEVPLDDFYRAINRVERSLIRTDADEVTYNLHVIIRFELELELLEGRLPVRELPERWHELYRGYLGITAPDDRDGVLQDVHWYGGLVGGAFQGYTLGNILSAQFYESALKAHPAIESEIESGTFGTLHRWLIENIYQHGSKYSAPELIQRATGNELQIEPYVRYLKSKYGEIYRL